MRVSPPGATRFVDRLEGKGLVQRKSSKADRRTAVLMPTAEACSLVQQIQEIEGRALDEVMGLLTREQEERLFEGLTSFIEALVKSRKADITGLCLRCGEAHDVRCILAGDRGEEPL